MEEIFSRRLVELLEERDMSQLQLSQLVGTSNVTISRYITCSRKPRIEIVAKIANVLNTSVDYLLGFSNVKTFTGNQTGADLIHIHDKLDSLGLLNSKHELSHAQVEIIEKILEANKDFIGYLKDDDSSMEA